MAAEADRARRERGRRGSIPWFAAAGQQGCAGGGQENGKACRLRDIGGRRCRQVRRRGLVRHCDAERLRDEEGGRIRRRWRDRGDNRGMSNDLERGGSRAGGNGDPAGGERGLAQPADAKRGQPTDGCGAGRARKRAGDARAAQGGGTWLLGGSMGRARRRMANRRVMARLVARRMMGGGVACVASRAADPAETSKPRRKSRMTRGRHLRKSLKDGSLGSLRVVMIHASRQQCFLCKECLPVTKAVTEAWRVDPVFLTSLLRSLRRRVIPSAACRQAPPDEAWA